MARPHRSAHLALRSFGLLGLLAIASSARADSFDGKWRQSPLREEYTVQQWFPDCGPAPATGSSGGGELVTIQSEGDELSIVGGGRTFRTNQCYDLLPTLVRDSHTRDGGGRSWRTRCATPPSDPRRATINTFVSLPNDARVDVAESGRYEITIKEGKQCIADVKRSRSFERVVATPATPASATPAPEPTHAPEPTSRACTNPGEPARLEVRPSRKLLRTGESFVFRAVVTDAKGCATPTPVTWEVAPAADGKTRLQVDTAGKVTVTDDAPEGNQDLVVAAAGKNTHVTVAVSSPAHYDALLAESGLNAVGENDETSVAVITQGALGGREATAVGNAMHRRNTFIAVVAALAGVLGLIAVIGWRRARRAAQLQREAEARHEQRVRETEERRRENAAMHAAQMKAHEESLERAMAAASTHGVGASPGGVDDGMAATGSERTSETGDEFAPYVVGSPTKPLTAKGKICPTCGDRFDGSASFCGKDGTALVLLN
ncbi:MAG TPA: hypothetical protein VNO21_17935 [Polyangiaceae bacterium]|nr:hypothetical protein [Polyangiaceae bacterium]